MRAVACVGDCAKVPTQCSIDRERPDINVRSFSMPVFRRTDICGVSKVWGIGKRNPALK